MRRLALSLICVGCTSEPGVSVPPPLAPSAFQMNDLSILLPLATGGADFAAYLGPTSPGVNGPLLPEALYAADPANVGQYDELHVVAVRFDPCFGHVGPITDPASCDNQMRLVFQSFGGFSPVPPVGPVGPFDPDDDGVHVLYQLTRAQLLDAVGEVAAARAELADGDLGPLAVHPLAAAEGLTGPFVTQLGAIVSTYADASKIERITSFSAAEGNLTAGSGFPPPFWELQGSTVANGSSAPLSVPTEPDGTAFLGLTATASPLEAGVPDGNSPDDFATLASASAAGSASTVDRQAAFDAALRVENPMKNSTETIDCISCHLAEPARVLVGEDQLGLSPAGDSNAFAADPSIPAADLAATTQANLVGSDGILNIHAFSYRLREPMINQRVIDETAANLAYLRTLASTPD